MERKEDFVILLLLRQATIAYVPHIKKKKETIAIFVYWIINVDSMKNERVMFYSR